MISEHQKTDWRSVKKPLLGKRLNPKQKSILLQALNGTAPTPDWLTQHGWQVDNIWTICGGLLDAQHCLMPYGTSAGTRANMEDMLSRCLGQPAPVKEQVSPLDKYCCTIDGVFQAEGFALTDTGRYT